MVLLMMTRMMRLMTNLARTLAFSAIASGLGVFVPILWQASKVKASTVKASMLSIVSLACSRYAHFRTDLHLAN